MNGANEDWDVEQHKGEHECDEHWELKRKFLLTHKGKFPEDQLVCLAQVFTNVELLGCSYPKETMQLVAQLSKDIASKYREKHRHKLHRTFVKASDAVMSRLQGVNPPRCDITDHGETTSDHKSSDETSDSTDNCKVLLKKVKMEEGPYGNIVLVERLGDQPQAVITCSTGIAGSNLEWKYDKIDDLWKCSIFIDSKLLAEASGPNRKVAKKEASVIGLHKLQKHYYTIKIKQNLSEDASVATTTMLRSKIPNASQSSIPDDNIGIKLMKLMGWTGGGLGKSQQGIVEPVTIKQQVRRDGLGLKSKSSSNDLRVKCRGLLKKYRSGDTREDLVFSPDFTNEERAVIHQVARQMGLKSHSYGPKDKRTLVISRKIDVWDLVQELKNLGGMTNKYELLEPQSL